MSSVNFTFKPKERVRSSIACWSSVFPLTTKPSSALAESASADAKADGFASLAELHRTLDEIYPGHKTDARAWFRVTFRFLAAQAAK